MGSPWGACSCSWFQIRQAPASQDVVRSRRFGRVQDLLRGHQESEEVPLRRVLHQGREVHCGGVSWRPWASYDDYLNDLQKGGDGECRYGLYDYEYEHQCQGTTESSKKQKLFLMAWCPDSAKIKKKMLYSSSFDALKKSLVGVHKFIQATDLSEASEGEVEKQLRSTDRV